MYYAWIAKDLEEVVFSYFVNTVAEVDVPERLRLEETLVFDFSLKSYKIRMLITYRSPRSDENQLNIKKI